MTTAELPYRQNVCMLIFREPNLLFLGERTSQPGHWQFPQGGVEPGFTLEQNVLREAQEELGAPQTLFKILARLQHRHRYDFFETPPYAVGKFRGQEQTFWLLQFLGEDSQIDLSQSEHEFSNWRWATLDEVKQYAAPRRLSGYEAALEEFRAFIELKS